MENQTGRVMPVQPEERILSLDVLRGFAILGILIMNIQSYSMINTAYLNPTAYGDLTGINLIVWILSHLFADQKFMTIFSLLFGAGILLFCNKAEEKGDKAAPLHYRRNFWLLIIGLIHAYLFWHGDILVPYALCAFIVFLFRKYKPKTLMILGSISLLVPMGLYFMFGSTMPFWPSEATENLLLSWNPSQELIDFELNVYRGGLASQMMHRVPTALMFQTFLFIIWSGWRVGGLMLIGMAFFKWGIFTGKRSKAFYRNWIIFGLLTGLALSGWGIYRNFVHDWSLEYSMFFGSQYNYLGSLFVVMAYIAIVIQWSLKSFSGLTRRLAATGRMAFTNYLAQTLICTFIFYGHGFGLFGKIERWQQILIVFGIWILQLLISPIWLKHFRFGPVEWLWRSLAYWKIQKLRSNS